MAACVSKPHFIDAEQTLDLRHRVLRAHQPKEACRYPGDQDIASFHVGATVQGKLQCVASFYRESTPYLSDSPLYRLRGMATAPQFRGQGLGGAVLDWGCSQVASRGGAQLWCNARVSAMDFYLGRAFVKVSDVFEIEGIGEHFVLAKRL